MSLIVAVVLSYVLGSIPAAYIAGRMHGIDLRTQGSGNLGATNVFRVLGAGVGIAVFVFDMTKGAVPVLLFPSRIVAPASWPVTGDSTLLFAILCGLAAIVGHVRPVFMKFGKGGKGVATASGVFVALAPVPTLLTVVVFAVTVLTSGYVSLGSLVCAALMPVLLAITVGVGSWLFWCGAVVSVFVFWTHRANLGRLRRGQEHRFGKVGAPQRTTATAAAIGGAIALAVLFAVRFA
jgi:glycerol-3-phosphate acyltransferase PlsY